MSGIRQQQTIQVGFITINISQNVSFITQKSVEHGIVGPVRIGWRLSPYNDQGIAWLAAEFRVADIREWHCHY